MYYNIFFEKKFYISIFYIIFKKSITYVGKICCNSIRKRRIKDSAFQNKKRPKSIGEIADAFLDGKLFGNLQGILQNILRLSEKYVIIG